MVTLVDKILGFVETKKSQGYKISKQSYQGQRKTLCFMECVIKSGGLKFWNKKLNSVLEIDMSSKWYVGFFAELGDSFDETGWDDKKIIEVTTHDDFIAGKKFAQDLVKEYESRGGTLVSY